MQELKKKIDYWQVIFMVTTAVGGVAVFIKIIYRLVSALWQAGFCMKSSRIKKTRFKIIAYVCELVLIFGAFALSA